MISRPPSALQKLCELTQKSKKKCSYSICIGVTSSRTTNSCVAVFSTDSSSATGRGSRWEQSHCCKQRSHIIVVSLSSVYIPNSTLYDQIPVNCRRFGVNILIDFDGCFIHCFFAELRFPQNSKNSHLGLKVGGGSLVVGKIFLAPPLKKIRSVA